MPLYLGSDLISDVYIGIAASGIATTAISITANGSYTPPSGTYYSGINVNVPIGSTINNLDRIVTPTTQTLTITAASGYTGLGTITVNPIPSEFIVPSGTTLITVNGSYDISHYATATVNVASGTIINNLNVTITPTESTTVVLASSGYTGLGMVTINGISTTYIGSQIPQITSEDFTISENSFSIPTGYIETETITFNNLMDYGVPLVANISITTATGLITVEANMDYYDLNPTLESGNVYTAINSTDIATLLLPVQIATTYTPGTSALTITAGKYITGTQYIKGDSNLIAGNIKQGVSIFGVAGSYSGASVSNQDISITPTESTTVVSAASGYTGLGNVTVNGISTTYIGSQVPQKTSSDLSVSGNTMTVPIGYYATTAIASITASSMAVSNISGQAYLESTNDYGWRTVVSIPAGYYEATTITATYSSFFPTPSSTATNDKILLGYQAYDQDGILMTGSMANNDFSAVLNQSTTAVTIPAGYHDGTGTVSHSTVTVPNPTVSVSSTNGIITASGTWTRGFTTNTSYSTTAQLTMMTLPTAAAAASNNGTGKATINRSTSIQYINIPAGYNSTTAYYQISAVANGSASMPSSLSATNATVSSNGTTLSLVKSVSGTPTVSAGYISAGTSSSTTVTLSVTDANFTAANIKSGVTMFGRAGTFTSDGNAVAADINSGKIAYVNGAAVTGTQVINKYYTGSSAPSSSLGNNGDIYLRLA